MDSCVAVEVVLAVIRIWDCEFGAELRFWS